MNEHQCWAAAMLGRDDNWTVGNGIPTLQELYQQMDRKHMKE